VRGRPTNKPATPALRPFALVKPVSFLLPPRNGAMAPCACQRSARPSRSSISVSTVPRAWPLRPPAARRAVGTFLAQALAPSYSTGGSHTPRRTFIQRLFAPKGISTKEPFFFFPSRRASFFSLEPRSAGVGLRFASAQCAAGSDERVQAALKKAASSPVPFLLRGFAVLAAPLDDHHAAPRA